MSSEIIIVPANKISELPMEKQIRIWRAFARKEGEKPDGLTVAEWAAKQVTTGKYLERQILRISAIEKEADEILER